MGGFLLINCLLSLQGLASCFGICAINHLEETLAKLEEFVRSDVFKKSVGLFSIFKVRASETLRSFCRSFKLSSSSVLPSNLVSSADFLKVPQSLGLLSLTWSVWALCASPQGSNWYYLEADWGLCPGQWHLVGGTHAQMLDAPSGL